MGTIRKRLYEIITLCISVMSLLPVALLGFYSRPSMDDYDFSLISHEALQTSNFINIVAAPFKNMVHFYNTHQGTFTNSFLLALNPMVINEKAVCLFPLIFILFVFIMIHYCIKVLNKIFLKVDWLYTLSVSVVLTAALLIWLPSVTEGILWFNSSMTYTPWMILVFVPVASILDIYFCDDDKKRRKKIIGTAILAFVISGACQTVAFEQILILLCISVFLIVSKKRYYSVAAFSSACLGFLISFLSPGTSARQSSYERAGIIETVIAVIYKVRDDAGNAFSIVWLLSLLAVTPFLVELIKSGKEHFPKRFPIIQILACLMVICGMWCVPYYPTKTFGAPRLWNAVWVTFIVFSWFIYSQILGWLVNIGVIRFPAESGTEDKKNIGRAVYRLIPAICLCALMVCTKEGVESNTLRCVHDLRSGRAAAFAAENDARFKLFNESDEDIVYVDPIQTKDTLLYFGDIYIFPDEWPNYSVGKYYGKKVALSYDPFMEDTD